LYYSLYIMNPGKLIGFGIIIVVAVLALAQATYVVDPGFRGVLVTLGKVSDEAKPEGFGTKSPFISHLVRVAGGVLLVRPAAGERHAARPLPHSREPGRQHLQELRRRSV
jgi:regulator of protease activity HflC (stomatin/prohibitin superfamily)